MCAFVCCSGQLCKHFDLILIQRKLRLGEIEMVQLLSHTHTHFNRKLFLPVQCYKFCIFCYFYNFHTPLP